MARATAALPAETPAGTDGSKRASGLKTVAYFSMEFGLGEALPVYSGGLGILAGDYLKTASDLGVPVVGVGLLYQQGYFRQILDPDGRQQEVFPYNDPTSLPVTPVQTRRGRLAQTIRLELPGRSILVRVWQAQVGRATLYLLDSNDLLNSPADRGATALLYPSGEKTAPDPGDYSWQSGAGKFSKNLVSMSEIICHLNEGHAAFAVLARARSFMRRTRQPFSVALLGNQGRQCVYDPYVGRSGVRPVSARTDSSLCDLPRGADACTDSRSSSVGADSDRDNP